MSYKFIPCFSHVNEFCLVLDISTFRLFYVTVVIYFITFFAGSVKFCVCRRVQFDLLLLFYYLCYRTISVLNLVSSVFQLFRHSSLKVDTEILLNLSVDQRYSKKHVFILSSSFLMFEMLMAHFQYFLSVFDAGDYFFFFQPFDHNFLKVLKE